MLNNLKWSAIASLSRYIIQTLSIIILARLISPESFGIISALLIIVTISYFVAQGGSLQIIVSCDDSDLAPTIFKSLCISLISSVFIYSLTFYFCGYIAKFLNISNDRELLTLVMLSVIFRALTTPLEGYFVRKGDFSKIAKIEFFSYLIGYFFVSISLAYLGAQEKALVWAVVAQSAMSLIIYIVSFSGEDFKLEYSLNGFWNQFKRSINFSLYQFFSSVSGQVDNLFIARYMGNFNLGIYSRAYQLTVVPCNFFGQIINRVFLSTFANIHEKNSQQVKRQLKSSVVFSASGSLVLCVLLIFYSDEIIRILLGEGWSQASYIFLLLSFSVFPRLLYKVNEPILLANNKERQALLSSIFYLLTLASLCYFNRFEGLEKIAISVVVATYVYSLSLAYIVSKLIPYVRRLYFSSLSFNFLFFLIVYWCSNESFIRA